MNISYRVLNRNDVEDCKKIRLQLLKENPKSFGSSYEEESSFDDEKWIRRLENKNSKTIGAYDGDTIIGVCVVVTNPRMKMKHKATLNSMFVQNEYRGKGISYGLMNTSIELLKSKQIEFLHLSVVSSNIPAIALYQKYGFTEEGFERNAIKHNGEYFDLTLMSKKI